MLRSLLLGVVLLLPLVGNGDDAFKPKAEHLVLVVWDGMRPDFITAENTPNLHALAKGGTFFAHHHSVYITSTEVNGAALATGCYPNRTGILANREYRPEIDPLKPFGTENAQAIALGDSLRGGKYIRINTIAELVQQAGHRTAIAGTKPVTLLHDRSPTKAHGSAMIFAGKSYPEDLAKNLAPTLGTFPDYPAPGTVAPNTGQNAWTTRALTEQLWKDGVPKFSTLWLGDPDFSQHLTQPGSPTALAAIRDSDTNLGTLLAALEAKGVRDKTDLFLVSDHAFSTVDRGVDLVTEFRAAGLTLVREYKSTPKPGEILLISLGGSCQLYVPGHDAAWVRQLVEFLQRSDFAGPIFTREPQPGTFPLHDARLDSPDAADIVFSFRWSEAKNQHGIPGSFVAEGRKPGFGTHASLSRFDVHNTLVAAGPDIRPGFVNELPSANVDVAPTILRLLGITPPETRDGRVLLEAIPAAHWTAPKPATKTVESTAKGWRQYLQITTFADRTYLDEGNAANVP